MHILHTVSHCLWIDASQRCSSTDIDSNQGKDRGFREIGSAWHVGEPGSFLQNVVHQYFHTCLFWGLQIMHLLVWTVFVEYHTRVLNLWAGATQCQLRLHPDGNWERNLRCWNNWPESFPALPLLTRNSSRWTTLCVMRNVSMNIYISYLLA